MKWHRRLTPLACCLLCTIPPGVRGQDRAHDAPFSCEPVVTGSVVFRGVALENYNPGKRQLVRFQIEEAFFGLPRGENEREVPLEIEQAIRRGEELIVASSPDSEGETW